MEIAKNIAKHTLTFFAVGVVLAFAAPYLAAGIGLSEAAVAAVAATHTPLWTGVFFGAFGGINAAIAPAFDWVFSGKSEAKIPEHHASAEKSSPSVTVNIGTPQTTIEHAPEKKFQTMLAAQEALAMQASKTNLNAVR